MGVRVSVNVDFNPRARSIPAPIYVNLLKVYIIHTVYNLTFMIHK